MQGNPQMQMQMQQMQMQMQMQMNMGMSHGQGGAVPPNPQQFMIERNSISNQDLIELARAAPTVASEEDIAIGLAQILRLALDRGERDRNFLARLRAALKPPKGQDHPTDRRPRSCSSPPTHDSAGEGLPARARKGRERQRSRGAQHALAITWHIYAKEKKTSSSNTPGKSPRPYWRPARSTPSRRKKRSAAPWS